MLAGYSNADGICLQEENIETRNLAHTYKLSIPMFWQPKLALVLPMFKDEYAN
jgi:hypothetical protein